MKLDALSTAALEALVQAPSLAILAVDKQGSVILWSPSAERMFGWTESEVLGHFLPNVPEEQRQGIIDRIQGALSGETVSPLDVSRLRKDGSLIDVSVWTPPLRDSAGNFIGVLALYADITERKQAGAELSRVLGAVSDCIYSGEFDSDGRFYYHYYSAAAERILGRPPLFFLVGPERWLSAVHHEDRPRLAQIFQRLQSGQSNAEEAEYRIVLPDGSIRWVRDNAVISPGLKGRRFINGVVTDITARKQMELALQKSEAELRQVLDAASDYFWSGEINPQRHFRYLYYSPAVERITGRPAEFYMPGPERWMSTVHPEDRPRLDEISERRFAGQPVPSEDEHRIVLPDGTIRWVRARVTISEAANGFRRLDGVVSDITARKQAEETLQETRAELERVLGAVPDYIWSGQFDPDGRFSYRYNSPAVERILGRPAEFFRGGQGRWLSILHPEDRPRAAQAADRLLTGRSSSEDEEYRVVLPDGAIRWVRNSVAISQSPAGLRCLNGVVSDITARKEAAEALQKTQTELREVLAAVPDYIWSGQFDPDGRFSYRYNSPSVERIFGRPAEFFRADSGRWLSIVHPEDRPRVVQATDRLRTGQSVLEEEEYRIVLPDGAIHWVRESGTTWQSTDGRRFVSGVASDITARKQAEQALSEKEHLLSESQRIAHIGSWGWDLSGSIKWTAETYRLYGQSPETFTPTNDSLVNLLHPEDRPAMQRWIEACRAGQSPDDLEFRLILPDGSVRHLSGRGELIHDTENRPVYMAGTVQDITEQKQAEEALVRAHDELEQRVRARTAELVEANETLRLRSTALEAAANGIVITDRDGHIVWANTAFTKLTGYELSEVTGKNLRLLKSGQHGRGFYQKLWRTVLSGKAWRGEIVNKRKDGSLYTEEMTITPVRNAAGEITHFVAIKQDVTERQLAAESRQRLAAIVESSDDAIISTDLQSKVTSWNAGAQRLFKYTAKEALGRSISVLFPRNRRDTVKKTPKQLLHGGHIQHFEAVRFKKGGVPVQVSVSLSPIRDDAGNISGISAIYRDITERKDLERAAAEAASREQRRIGLDLHDSLCQELTGISLLWKTVNQSVAAQSLPDAATVREVGRLLVQTIGQARDLAHGLSPVELESNDLGAALKHLGLSTRRLFNVSCVVHCRQRVRLADMTVATHLYRVAQEAVTNAIRHGKADRIWISLGRRKDRLTLRVRDNGSGFSRRRIFKPGMGMRSMRYRAKAIGGLLDVDGGRGTGTTVTLSLSPATERTRHPK